MKKIGFIGTGNMAMAIIGGILKSRIGMRLMAYDINSNNYDILLKNGIVLCESPDELVKKCEYVILAIKPQNFPEVLKEIKNSVSEDTVIISIAAGITEEYVSSQIGFVPKFIQVMPNTPLLINSGATALAKGTNVISEEFDFVKSIFSLSGQTEVLPLDKMNETIAINGSSPAFIYLFSKGFLQFAKEQGIDEKIALSLFCASLKGSADMMIESGKSIDELIKTVSSPGGTTIAGLEQLEKNELLKTVNNACKACTKRAYELSK